MITCEVNMLIIETAIGVLAIYLLGLGEYGFAATALFVLAFMLWWDSQPGPSLDQDTSVLPDERPKARYRKGK